MDVSNRTIQPRYTWKTAISIILATILLTSAFWTLWFAYGQTPSSTFTISPGIYPGASSYTIWREGSTYYIKDSNGALSDSDNFTVIFQYCITNMPSAGGEIFLRAGSYIAQPLSITDQSNIKVKGEGFGTIITLAASSSAPLFNITRSNYTVIEYLAIRGNRANQVSACDGIFVKDSLNCRFENLDIRDCYGDGIEINSPVFGNHWIIANRIVEHYGCGLKLYAADCFIQANDIGAVNESCILLNSAANDVIDANRLYMSGWDGTQYTGGGFGIDVFGANRETITDNQITDCALEGIRLANSENSTIADNYVVDNDRYSSTRAGIRLNNSNRTKISGGMSCNLAQTSQDYGVLEDGSSNWNTIVDISCFNNVIAGIIISGTNSQCANSYNGTTWVS